MAMPDLVLGRDVPELLVILQSGIKQKFAITIEVEPSDLVGIDCVLVFDDVSYPSILEGTTYTWTLTAADVATLTHQPNTVLSLGNADSQVILGRGRTEVRL